MTHQIKGINIPPVPKKFDDFVQLARQLRQDRENAKLKFFLFLIACEAVQDLWKDGLNQKIGSYEQLLEELDICTAVSYGRMKAAYQQEGPEVMQEIGPEAAGELTRLPQGDPKRETLKKSFANAAKDTGCPVSQRHAASQVSRAVGMAPKIRLSRIDVLEDEVARLEAENAKLKRENRELRKQLSQLTPTPDASGSAEKRTKRARA